MGDLTKLIRLCSDYNVEFPSLKEFEIKGCPQLKEFIFDETVATPNLQDLSVYEIPQIEQIWHNLLSPLSSCVQNLTELRVHRCGNLKAFVSSSMTISDELQGKDRRDTIVFPKLNYLEMRYLTKLTRLCSDYNVEFPLLEEFEIEGCPQLKEFIFHEMVATPNLQDLSVYDIPQIEQIWHNLLSPLSSCVQNLTQLRVHRCGNLKALVSFSTTISKESQGKERRDTIAFPKLNCLEMGDLTKLTRLCSDYNIEFPSLKQFAIKGCPQLKEFIFDETVATPNLQDLRVYEIPQIEQIWHDLLSPLSSYVQNLTKLKVHQCGNLKALILSSTTISEESRGKDRRDTIAFPKLNCLKMGDLARLTRLCSDYNIEFPSLEEFKIEGCPQLKDFIFDETVATPNLQDLHVYEIPQIEQIWHSLLSPLSSCVQNLTKLRVHRCVNLKALVSSSTTILEGSRGKDRRDTIAFPKLNCLLMGDLTRLTRLCSDYNIEFPSLEEFEIKGCPQLKEFIFDQTVATPNLQDLRVYGIPQIEQIWHNLLSPLSSCIQNLTKLRVNGCDNLKALVSSSTTISEELRGKETRDTIVFPKLNCLEMGYLWKLTRLCSTYNIEFSSLVEFQIRACPQLKEFIFDETVATPNLQNLSIYAIPQIEQIWHNLLSPLSSCLQNLTKLSVHGCDNLKVLISSSTAISEESRGKERRDTIVFPKLNCIEMGDLTKLTRLCSGYNIEFPSLEQFEIRRCPQLKEFIFYEMVATPNLQDLSVYEIPQIKQIWHNLICPLSSCVQNLTELSVHRCGNLKTLISSSTTISEESRGKEMRDTIAFPKLNYLDMGYLTKLTRLFSDYNIEFPSLEEFEIGGCPQLKKFIFDETVVTPNLQDLSVYEIPQIEQIWHSLLSPLSSCIQNLTKLRVHRCVNLKALVSSSMTISEESREKVRRDTIAFPKLNCLEMGYLTKLTRLCFDYNIEFPSLEEFEIGDCPQLKEFIFDETVATPNLQDLSVYEIPQIERIWHNLLSPLSSCIQNLTQLRVHRCDNLRALVSSSMAILEESREKESRDTIAFPKSNCLEMGYLTKTRLCSAYNIEFLSLEEFEIGGCPQLKEFIFDETVKVPKLKELRIFNMNNLKMIWHNKCTEDSFSKLKSLEVTMCHKLLTVFPSNMCGRLLSLESLNVDDCYSLVQICDIPGINSEEYEHVPFMNLQELKVLGCPSLKYIFAKEGVAAKEVPAKFVFPKLNSLKLKHLPKLGTFYPGKHTVEGPTLKRLELYDCGIHYTDEEGQTQQPLYLVQQLVFPCLEELELTGKQLTMMGEVQVPEYLLHKLKILNVREHESTVFPTGIIQRCQNLENLLVAGLTFSYGDDQTQAGSCKEIFFCGEDQTQAAPLAKVKTLVLQDLQDMKYMWEQDSIWDLIFQNLEVLTVDRCNSLVNLMPPSASLQNLTILNVRNCNSLETVVTSSMAESLMKLETMWISHCPNITEVIQNHGEVTEKIIFSNLKTLELVEADNLTSFCSCNFTLEFPSLEKLKLCSCRNMKTFSQGDLTMPRLKDVMIERKYFELCPDTNLNTIIQQFHAERYSTKIDLGCSSSEDME